jgi:hypothetical protein
MSDELEAIVLQDIDKVMVEALERRFRDYLLVGILRYGAHLPHLWRSASRRIPLILGHMVEFYEQEFYEQPMLVMDDTVYRGTQMQHHVKRLRARGVREIRTAAVIVHENSEFEPDLFIGERTSDRRYVAWKNALSRLVHGQRRSTDRDHPLYYFNVDGVTPGTFLGLLERFGYLSTVPSSSYGTVYAFSLTVDSAVIERKSAVVGEWTRPPGVTLEQISKIRFYWSVENGRLSLTAVPIAFVNADIDTFLADGGKAFANLVGCDLIALDYLRSRPESWRKFAYYLCSRAVAARLLTVFLEDFVPALASRGGSMQAKDPDAEDGYVSYRFPRPYDLFHSGVMERLRRVVKHQPGLGQEALRFGWAAGPWRRTHQLYDKKSRMPREYALLDILTRESDCARFDGKDWVALKTQGMPLSAFLSAVPDPLLVSRALDELLDCGLLRAKDGVLGSSGAHFARLYFPGGEFNARIVSRLAHAYRAEGVEPAGSGDALLVT